MSAQAQEYPGKNAYASGTGEIITLRRGLVVTSKHDGSQWLVRNVTGEDSLLPLVTIEIIEPGLSGTDTIPMQAVREMFTIACTWCRDATPVDHMGMRGCRSGSLASGGGRAHCTCDGCF